MTGTGATSKVFNNIKDDPFSSLIILNKLPLEVARYILDYELITKEDLSTIYNDIRYSELIYKLNNFIARYTIWCFKNHHDEILRNTGIPVDILKDSDYKPIIGVYPAYINDILLDTFKRNYDIMNVSVVECNNGDIAFKIVNGDYDFIIVYLNDDLFKQYKATPFIEDI